MNGDLVYHEVDGLAIADIKPVNVKNRRIGLRVAKFTREGKYITTYASTKDAANALTIELKKTNTKHAYYAIVKACTPKGNSKTAYGYQWRYISNDGGIVKRDCD
jgi:hypothetical protein